MFYKYMLLVTCGVVITAGEMDTSISISDSSKCENPQTLLNNTSVIKGEVVLVDLIDNTIIIKTKKNEEKKIFADTATLFVQNNNIGDLKAGDSVTIKYRIEEGLMMAMSIIEKEVDNNVKK